MSGVRACRWWWSVLAGVLLASLAKTTAAADEPRLEMVFVVDTTRSMGDWLPRVAEGTEKFIGNMTDRQPLEKSLRLGLLFFRDRKSGSECDLGYITYWRVKLEPAAGYETVSSTISGLQRERETTCSSDEEEEAVWDALNRAILDPAWTKGSRRTVILIGDAPPHGSADPKKNPMNLSKDVIAKSADERQVRIHSLLVQRDPMYDFSDYKALANERPGNLRGWFQSVPERGGDLAAVVTETLMTEWTAFQDNLATMKK